MLENLAKASPSEISNLLGLKDTMVAQTISAIDNQRLSDTNWRNRIKNSPGLYILLQHVKSPINNCDIPILVIVNKTKIKYAYSIKLDQEKLIVLHKGNNEEIEFDTSLIQFSNTSILGVFIQQSEDRQENSNFFLKQLALPKETYLLFNEVGQLREEDEIIQIERELRPRLIEIPKKTDLKTPKEIVKKLYEDIGRMFPSRGFVVYHDIENRQKLKPKAGKKRKSR